MFDQNAPQLGGDSGCSRSAATTTILYATDLRPETAATCDYALTLARQLGARAHILHVVEPPVQWSAAIDPSAQQELVWDATRQIRERLEVDEAAQRCVSGVTVVSGIATDTILAEATRIGADMIVIGTTEEGILAHLLRGSVASTLFRRSPVPVLVVPLQESEA